MAAMSSEPLLPVYLLTGGDRPKHLRALQRLRSRFGSEAVEQHSADSTSGEDAVAACNALGLFGGDGGGRLVVVQGVEMGRPSRLECVVRCQGGAAVEGRVTGRSVPIAHGQIRRP